MSNHHTSKAGVLLQVDSASSFCLCVVVCRCGDECTCGVHVMVACVHMWSARVECMCRSQNKLWGSVLSYFVEAGSPTVSAALHVQ